MSRLPLTELEKKAWGYILGYMTDNPYAPTRQEIATAMGYNLSSGRAMAQHFLRQLEKKGFIKFGKTGWRNIELNTK